MHPHVGMIVLHVHVPDLFQEYHSLQLFLEAVLTGEFQPPLDRIVEFRVRDFIQSALKYKTPERMLKY